MDAEAVVKHRVVFDTTTVLSALYFRVGKLAWMRSHWQESECTPLVSQATAAELTLVLNYPKFHLAGDQQRELLADYLPWCEIVDVARPCPVVSRDRKDQPFLDLAHTGKAEILVSGDKDLLSLRGKTKFAIQSPEEYLRSVFGE
ncbi:MAG TPA: putative toxin-antitoxin system toxin component, PIN family [Acidobacteriaceae bacterium]